jgi:putative hydrolase of the HAD superfamily
MEVHALTGDQRAGLPVAVLVDLDDTILEFPNSARASWLAVARTYAARAGCSAEALFEAVWQTRDALWRDEAPASLRAARMHLHSTRRDIVTRALASLGAQPPDGLVDELAISYGAMRAEAVRAFPGAIDTLRRLRTEGVRLGLVTNGPAAVQRPKVDRFELEALFDYVLIEGEFGAGKPDARVFRHVLAELGVGPHEAWMVGDHLEWDVAGAQRIGVYAIWVDSYGEGLPTRSPVRPDRIIGRLAELTAGLA